MPNCFWIYIVCINLVTFVIYGWDKWKAVHHKWRVREAVLLLLAAIGGAVGAYLAMLACHHKTRKWYFKIPVPLLAIAYIAGCIWFYSKYGL